MLGAIFKLLQICLMLTYCSNIFSTTWSSARLCLPVGLSVWILDPELYVPCFQYGTALFRLCSIYVLSMFLLCSVFVLDMFFSVFFIMFVYFPGVCRICLVYVPFMFCLYAIYFPSCPVFVQLLSFYVLSLSQVCFIYVQSCNTSMVTELPILSSTNI